MQGKLKTSLTVRSGITKELRLKGALCALEFDKKFSWFLNNSRGHLRSNLPSKSLRDEVSRRIRLTAFASIALHGNACALASDSMVRCTTVNKYTCLDA